MAKKPKVAKLNIKVPSPAVLATAAKNEDKGQNKGTFGHARNELRAMQSIVGKESAANYKADEGTISPRSMARAGRKKSTRISRRSGRR